MIINKEYFEELPFVCWYKCKEIIEWTHECEDGYGNGHCKCYNYSYYVDRYIVHVRDDS